MKSIKMILIISLIFFISGCAQFKSFVASVNFVPSGCEDSVIYANVPAPKITAGILYISVLELSKTNQGFKNWILKILDHAEELANNKNITYIQFSTSVLSEIKNINKYWGSEIIIVTQTLDYFDKPITIGQCDRDLIIKFCTNQRTYLKMISKISVESFFSLYEITDISIGDYQVY